MTGATAVSLALAAAGVLILPEPAPLHVARSPAPRPAVPDRWRRAAVVAVGIAAVEVLLGPWPWWVGLVVALAGGAAGSTVPPRRDKVHRGTDRARLAVHADLLAACLEAGLSMAAALTAVSATTTDVQPARPRSGRPPSVRSRSVRPRSAGPRSHVEPDAVADLSKVAALLLLGTDPDRAWQTVADRPELAGLVAAARRSAVGGAVLAVAVREHAAALRAASTQAAERAAGRAGVAMTAPLGGCFLPAFLCLGLAPVVIGLLATLDLF